MRRFALYSLVLFACAVVVALGSTPAYAVDGVVLINQNTSVNGLPGCGSSGFPIVICQPGSYRLSGNLVPGTTAIKITADDVTLDLNGFSILGPVTGCPSACTSNGASVGEGIDILGGNVTVKNGNIQGMNDGVISFAGGTQLEEIHATQNQLGGFVFTLDGAVVRGCQVADNGRDGIQIGPSGIVEDNIVANNANFGIEASNATILSNVVMRNGGGGLSIQFSVYGSNILDNTANFVLNIHNVSQNNNICSGTQC